MSLLRLLVCQFSSWPPSRNSQKCSRRCIIGLFKAPDFGLGRPGNGGGLLAGALPTAGTSIDGVKRIIPDLMALGYATGRTLVPGHSGEYGVSDVHIDLMEDALARRSIRGYFSVKFQEVRDPYPELPADWPGTYVIMQLVGKASG